MYKSAIWGKGEGDMYKQFRVHSVKFTYCYYFDRHTHNFIQGLPGELGGGTTNFD